MTILLGSHRLDLAFGGRDRDHEHHAGVGDRAHPRNRHPHGRGRQDLDIRLQFIIEAMTLTMIGGAVGIFLGIVTAKAISYFSGWPVIVSVSSVLLGFGFSALVGIFFGFYPAYKASLLNPIDALRYE